MRNLARYFLAAVLMVFGAWITLGSVIIGNGVHLPGRADFGIPLAAVGLGTCLGAYNLVRQLPREAAYRTGFNIFLLLGSLSLIGTALKLAFERLAGMDQTEIAAQYDTMSYTYSFALGVMCLAMLIFVNTRLKPGAGSR